MLCGRFKQILFTKNTLNNNVQIRCYINARFISARCGVEGFWAALTKNRREPHKMNSVRFIFRDISVNRLWSAWTRNVNVGHVVRRYRRDRNVREMIQCFRQAFLRPRRLLMLSATAACQARRDEEGTPGKPTSCSRGISDEDLEALISELEGVDDLVKRTLFCEKCDKRMVIDHKHPGIMYCPCKDAVPPDPSPDGWIPYMEAEDVIIWRKEYKKGQGLYAYKVYGRYKDIKAEDYAAVNLDGAYRKRWDSAVAALSVVERNAYGVPDQAVLHWEVLWPRLFANRDYVYIRRHKEYDVKSLKSPEVFDDSPPSKSNVPPAKTDTPPAKTDTPPAKTDTPPAKTVTPPAKTVTPPTKTNVPLSGASVTPKPNVPPPKTNTPLSKPDVPPTTILQEERESVHSNAKRKSMESYSQEPSLDVANKVYVIISRSCTHPEVPVSKNAIRVSEYWSHMVVKTLDGADKPGMEFVLTYYDEPAVGGMPHGVAAWATGRAAPAYLQRMRLATRAYADYKRLYRQTTPDFTPFHPETKKVSFEEQSEQETDDKINEEDMESSKTGPDMENGVTRDQGTQTEDTPSEDKPKATEDKANVTEDKPKVTEDKAINTIIYAVNMEKELPTPPPPKDEKDECENPEEENDNGGWWRNLYPLYYFV